MMHNHIKTNKVIRELSSYVIENFSSFDIIKISYENKINQDLLLLIFFISQ